MKRWCQETLCVRCFARRVDETSRVPLISVQEADDRLKVVMEKLKERDVIIPFKRLRTQSNIDEDTIVMAILDGMYDTRRVDMENMYGYDSIREWMRTEFRKIDRPVISMVQMMNRERVTKKLRKGGDLYFFTEWVNKKINI